MSVNGPGIAVTATGALFVYAGIKGFSVLQTLQSVIKGQSPANGTVTNPVGTVSTTASVSSSGGNASGGSDAQNEALGKVMAAQYGWSTGAEWTALNNIVMAESGWNDEAANPTSNARGIAQNISGWSADYQPGNAQQQIAWLLSYIQGRYGDPVAAWQFHLANGWY